MSILLNKDIKKNEKKYLSYGGGINSTAMMIMLIDQGIEFEAVFVDHGGDYPETYKYVELLLQKGYPITVLSARVDDLNLTDYCKKYRIMPSRQQRWCTDKFKIKPMYEYFTRPCTVFIGFHCDEAQRAQPSRDAGIINEFPLIDYSVDQKGCEEIIIKAGLPVPMKSGCYYCPFQRVGQFRKLRDERPDLYCITKGIEDNFNERRKEQGKSPFYLKGDTPINKLVRDGQDYLFDGWRKPCQCGQ